MKITVNIQAQVFKSNLIQGFGIGIFILLLFPALLFANTTQEIQSILQQKKAPIGVVFEVLENEEKDIIWTLQKINQASQKLRQRFPKIGIAVVSHGNELFALTKDKKSAYSKVHSLVEQMNRNNIPIQVCGTAASWKDKTISDFPNYIDVVEAAPEKIEFYEDLGYLLIEVTR